MYLRDLAVYYYLKPEFKSFHNSFYHVVEIFLYYLPKKYNFHELAKVNINLQYRESNYYVEALGIGEYHYAGFDLKQFQALNEKEQELEILRIITSSFLFLAKKFNIDPEPIKEASRKSIESNFHVEVPLKISKSHSSRLLKANIIVTHKRGGDDVDLELIDKFQKKILRENIISGTDYFSIYHDFYKSKWVGDTFQILGRDGTITYEKKLMSNLKVFVP